MDIGSMQLNSGNVVCDGYLEGLVSHRWRIARSSSGVQEDGADRTYMTYRKYATMELLPCYGLTIAALFVANHSSGIENDWEGIENTHRQLKMLNVRPAEDPRRLIAPASGDTQFTNSYVLSSDS
jgi:hypothetical protein